MSSGTCCPVLPFSSAWLLTQTTDWMRLCAGSLSLPVLGLSHSPLWVWGCPELRERGSAPGWVPPVLARIGPCRCCNPGKSPQCFPTCPCLDPWMGCPQHYPHCCCHCSVGLILCLGMWNHRIV